MSIEACMRLITVKMPQQLYLSAPILVDRGYDYQTKDSHEGAQMNIKHAFLMLITPLFLAACDRDRITKICKDTPQYCQELHEDSWCRFERTDLIRSRKQQSEQPNDANDYDLLNKLKVYNDCLDPLLSIEYTRRKERKTDKVDAVYHAQQAITQLAADTADSDYPYLLLWHWQHQGSLKAKARFLKLADRPEMHSPELQNILAKIIMPRDSAAAEQALHFALSLYDEGDTIDSHIVANLLTLYTRQRRYREVWIWSRVLKQLEHEENIELARMDAYAQFDNTQQQAMQAQVEQIMKQLELGQYRVPEFSGSADLAQ
ncbi:DUF2989 domain-containing protein [Oceanisphaera pacifica]|uniref:DUF2989 domain-containing protein n=1 Tax=Oceanisphaera pacifica TaxID=2818389 RepID=A0ABS3NJG5_9GAMM|nr:DUF2989 domain-containing protein [Oceanisphaera pacifica]MBO1520670.1 DUF2989 domain-containing protein [Oceanisphaera pacifica]